MPRKIRAKRHPRLVLPGAESFEEGLFPGLGHIGRHQVTQTAAPIARGAAAACRARSMALEAKVPVISVLFSGWLWTLCVIEQTLEMLGL